MGPARRRHRPPVGELAARRGARDAVVLGLVLSAAGCGAIHSLQSEYLYPAQEARPDTPPPEGAEAWWLDVEGGRVVAWYLPPTRRSAGPGPAVVFAHGNRERIEDWPERLRPYREMGLAVLLPEYRGFGRATGEPSEAAIEGDLVHYVDRLADRPEIDAQRIVYHGRSLGGGVVGVLSTRRRCAALILESTFTNVPDLASRWMAPMGAIRDRFDTRDALVHSYTPTLILHGVRDTIIPFRHAVELDRIAWDSRLVAFDAGHDDLPRGEAYWGAIRALLESADVI